MPYWQGKQKTVVKLYRSHPAPKHPEFAVVFDSGQQASFTRRKKKGKNKPLGFWLPRRDCARWDCRGYKRNWRSTVPGSSPTGAEGTRLIHMTSHYTLSPIFQIRRAPFWTKAKQPNPLTPTSLLWHQKKGWCRGEQPMGATTRGSDLLFSRVRRPLNGYCGKERGSAPGHIWKCFSVDWGGRQGWQKNSN